MQNFWQPFATRLRSFLDAAPQPPTVTAGFMTPAEHERLYHEARHLNPQAAERIGLPKQSPFLRGRAAVLDYPDKEVEKWALRNGPKYGVHVDKDMPWMVRPLGDRFKGPGAVKPLSATDLLEIAVGDRFYQENPEAKYAQPEQGVSGGTPGQVNPTEEYVTDATGEYGEPGRKYTRYDPGKYTMPAWEPDLDALMGAIREQESNGNYDALGKEVEGQGKAEGAYQFMPASWAEWSTNYNRIFNNEEGELEQTPENQDLVAKWKLGQMLELNDNNIGAVLATWYGGGRAAKRHGAGLEPAIRINTPSIREYVEQVLGRYRSRLSPLPDYGSYE